MVLKQDGSVWATGWNEYGQLGDGSNIDRINYVQVVCGGAKAIAAGSRHSLMLKQDGSVWATGYNQNGQLGTGLSTNSAVFVKVMSVGVKVVAAGAYHSMVFAQHGGVWATGSNEYGQFGDGSTASQTVFVRLTPIAGGVGHETIMSCTCRSHSRDALFMSWQSLLYTQQLAFLVEPRHQASLRLSEIPRATVVFECQAERAFHGNYLDLRVHLLILLLKRLMLTAVVKFALGAQQSMILKQDGSVWSTAINLLNEFPVAAICKRFAQVISTGATEVAAGTGYSMIVKEDGSLWAMGRNSRGQLGTGTKDKKHSFVFVHSITGAKAVAAGSYHSMVLTEQGQVLVAGWNKYGQLGDDLTSFKTRFYVAMSTEVKAKAVAAGEMHSVVLKEDGSVWATGRNYNGQLGDGSKTDRSIFVQVISDGAADVAAGSSHSMVLKEEGNVWATGCNEFGQLGDGSTTDITDYAMVSSGAKAIAAGRRHSMVLKKDGSLWATGYNECGQLGDPALTNSKVFVEVISDGTKVVAAGAYHSMVLKQDGSVWATGSNKYGQFGDGSTTSEKTFVRLTPFGNGSLFRNCLTTPFYCVLCAFILPCYLFACISLLPYYDLETMYPTADSVRPMKGLGNAVTGRNAISDGSFLNTFHGINVNVKIA